MRMTAHRRLPTLLAGLVLVPSLSLAQSWTPQQVEVLQAIERCWDAWSEATSQQNHALWSEPCLADQGAKFWWAESVAPWTSRGWRKGHTTGLYRWGMVREGWTDMRPLSITIEGDFAFVFYAPAWQVEDPEGEVELMEQKRFEVLRRVDGRWKFYGGMGAPNQEG